MGLRGDDPRLPLGTIPFVKANIELLLVGIIALSLVPVALAALRARRQRAAVEGLAAQAEHAENEPETGTGR